ncbi:MAG: ATP-binding protein [Candidatus Riflebacteria bacterium]|nr:ATP-binding protein [Candidatus Riflebacteria bacterium]
MKIKKLIEAKQINEAEENEIKDYSDAQDLKDVNPQTANVDEIEASIQKLVGEASDGEKEMWAKSAAQFAKDDKQVAQDLNAGYVAFDLTAEDWADVTITNDLYITLDRAYANALKSTFLKNGSNVIVNGLPGSGKTAIVEAWCKMRGLYLCPFNATDEKSDAAINGMPMRSDDDPSAIKYLFNTKKLEWLISKDPKYKHKCVAFVDELNRQKTAQLRRPLMSLFNEKRNADGTLDFSRNLLFSIVCINPSDGQGGVFHDVVADIFGAEDDRFDDQVEEFDSTIENAQVFWQ